ncbi:MAG: universal stress protein [Planctomycetota bacterium]|jgi:universal stress protein A
MNVDHVLITTDLSEASLRPLSDAADFARSQNARLSILYVLEEVEAMAHGSRYGIFSPADADMAKQAADKMLAEFVEKADCLGELEVTPASIQETSVWRGVNKYVEQNGVDLIIVATHKNGLLERLFGTKADGIVHHAKVPVLCVPPKK